MHTVTMCDDGTAILAAFLAGMVLMVLILVLTTIFMHTCTDLSNHAIRIDEQPTRTDGGRV